MTILQTTTCPSIFDAGLPTFAYDHLTDPDEAHRVIADARKQAPIAIGPHGPEVLSYELVRTVLRDSRFITAHGLGLDRARHYLRSAVGPGDQQHSRSGRRCSIIGCAGWCRRRSHRAAPNACARESSKSSPGWSNRSPSPGAATSSPTSPAATPHRSSVRYWAHHPRTGNCSPTGPTTSKRFFEWNVANDGPAILAAWDQLDAYLEDLIARRRASLADDLISDLIRAEDNGDRLTHDELLMLCATLLGAGTDTTRNQLAAAVQVLCAHPDQWALLGRHPELAARRGS